MADFTALKTAIQTYIKQNGNEEITGEKLQEILLSVVTTLGDSAINDLVTALNDEVAARQNADGTLQQNITNEATARGNADTALGGRIDDEATARANGDMALSNRLGSTITAENTAADQIGAEAEARAAADTALQELIDGITDNIENGYVYAGIATPSSTPATGKVFYLALTAGTYTNFGNTEVSQGINILKYNGTAWSLDAFIGIDDELTPGSNNIPKSGNVLENIIKNGSAFDLSAYNAVDGVLATYADLDAALAALNLLPAVYKQGGMSFRFVQTSDNKYVQYRLTADEWSINTEDWAIADEGVYIENPEFVYVKTDKDNKILWAIKTDGGIYYGAGVPQQIVDYINEKIAELSLDEYEDIVAFLNGLEEGDKTLQTLLNEKVDKEEGKSLIDEDYASSQSAIDNTEYLQVTTDNEDKILEGIKQDGTKVIGGNLDVRGCAKILGEMKVSGVLYKVIENPEYLAAWVDAENKVIFGLKADGKTYVGDADFLNDIKNNQEAINEIKAILSTISSVIESLDIDVLSSITAVESPEFIEAKTDSEGKLLAGRTRDGAAFENVGFSTPKVSINGATIENIEDPEGRTEIETDAEGKILSYRDSDGVVHENVENNSYEFKKKVTTIAKDETLYVEKPKFGEFWFEGILPTDNSEERIPTTLKCTFKNSGITQFVCNCTLAIQGHGSASYPKKGFTFEPLNDKGKAINLKFGDMIETDSFHLKAYATDSLHCRDLGGYSLWRDLIRQLDWPYSKINNIPFEILTSYNKNLVNTADANYCPTGFPCACYLNGAFIGIYTLKLKKTRQNYAMEKSIKSMILLDTCDYKGLIHKAFDYTGWEVKNPKLKNYDAGQPVTDATVLASLNRFFDYMAGIDENDVSTYSDYADYINLPHWIAFLILEEVVSSIDIIGNNLNLATWDGLHWSIIPWDLDATIGIDGRRDVMEATGDQCNAFILTSDIWKPFKIIFDSEIKATYTKLRTNGFLSIENIVKHYQDICNSIPRRYYEMDFQKWGNIRLKETIPSFEQLIEGIRRKVEFLDGQWLLNQN